MNSILHLFYVCFLPGPKETQDEWLTVVSVHAWASRVPQYLWLRQRVSSYPYYKPLPAQGASLSLPRLLTPMEACHFRRAFSLLRLGSTLGSLLLFSFSSLSLLVSPQRPTPPNALSTPSCTLPYIYNKSLLNLGTVGRGTLAGEG